MKVITGRMDLSADESKDYLKDFVDKIKEILKIEIEELEIKTDCERD